MPTGSMENRTEQAMQFIQAFLTYLGLDPYSHYSYPPSRLQALEKLNDNVTCATCPPLIGTYLYESKCFSEGATGDLPENLTVCWYQDMYPPSVKDIPLDTPFCAYDATGAFYTNFTIENCPQRAYMDSDICTPCPFN